MKLMIKCSDLAQLTSEGNERTLAWHERILMRIHLLLCPPCVRFRRHMEFLGRVVKFPSADAAGAPGARLDAAARDRIRRGLDSR